MTLHVPVWILVVLISLLPFVWVPIAAAMERNSGGGMFSGLSALPALFGFLITAGACWVGLIVWAVMR